MNSCADQPAWQMWGVSLVSCPTGCQSLGVGRERFVLGLTGGVMPQLGILAGLQKWCSVMAVVSSATARSRNLNVCSQIKSCLYSLDAVEVGGNAHWIMPIWPFSVNTLCQQVQGLWFAVFARWLIWWGTLCEALLRRFCSLNGQNNFGNAADPEVI